MQLKLEPNNPVDIELMSSFLTGLKKDSNYYLNNDAIHSVSITCSQDDLSYNLSMETAFGQTVTRRVERNRRFAGGIDLIKFYASEMSQEARGA